MKVVLIQPPVQDFYDTEIRLQPIGLCYLKAAVGKYLPEVEVIVKDYHGGGGRRTVPLPEELSYLRAFYSMPDRSPFSTFHAYYHFGRTFESIADEVAAMNPDVVGITALFTPYFREALRTAEMIKKKVDVRVVMGGSHVSASPESMLSSPYVDYVITGEGERPFVELLCYLMGKGAVEDVSGLGYKRGERFFFNAAQNNYPIDELPVPDLSDLPVDCYRLGREPLAFVVTSRGCPQRCAFCSVHATFGNNYRRRSNDRILDEIEQRYIEGFRVFDFEDDNLTFNQEEFKELCLKIIERFPGRRLRFTAMNGISHTNLDEDMLDLMYGAGFTHLNLSLVSSDRQVLKTVKRMSDPGAYADIVKKAFQRGFQIVSYQIVGLPGESLSSQIGTFVMNARLPVLIGVSPFYLLPKTSLARGLTLKEDDFVKARLTAMAIESDECAREDIYSMLITARIINFLKGLDIAEDAEIRDLMNRSWAHERVQRGIHILQRLAQTGCLYFLTPSGEVPNGKFRNGLFFRILKETAYVTCLNGKRITVAEFPVVPHITHTFSNPDTFS